MVRKKIISLNVIPREEFYFEFMDYYENRIHSDVQHFTGISNYAGNKVRLIYFPACDILKNYLDYADIFQLDQLLNWLAVRVKTQTQTEYNGDIDKKIDYFANNHLKSMQILVIGHVLEENRQLVKGSQLLEWLNDFLNSVGDYKPVCVQNALTLLLENMFHLFPAFRPQLWLDLHERRNNMECKDSPGVMQMIEYYSNQIHS